jgi:O-antigen/teichoic acid export membrane protein
MIVRLREFLATPVLRSIGGMAGGNLLATIIGVVGALVQARYVAPGELGYFRQFAIVSGYVFFLHLGLFGALQRRYPLHIGQGRRDKALAVAEICQVWYIFVTLLITAVYMVLAAYSLTTGNWRATLAWLVQIVALASFMYGGYLNATYRSGHDFITVAKSAVLSNTLSLFLLPVFVIHSYIGLTLRNSMGELAALWYLHIRRPLQLPWRFNWREWLKLTKEGIQLFTASYGANTGWSVVETTLILKVLGTNSLGLWSMSFSILSAANKVAQAITAVYSPKVTEYYGKTNDVKECLRLCRKPMLWGGISMLLMGASCILILPFLVKLMMPRYVEAIPTMCLMMFFLPIIILELPFVLLIATGRWIEQNIVTYTGLACFTILASLALHRGWGLNGVVGASIIGRLIRIGLVYASLRRAYTIQLTGRV